MARGSSVPLPIMMVFAPPFMLLISALSLIQFASMYKSFVTFVRTATFPGAAEALQPVLEKFADVLEAYLGPASAFRPDLTHMLLCSILIALLMGRRD